MYCFSYRELFYGIGSIRSKEILSDLSNVSPFLINGIQMFYGGILLLIASIIVEQPNVTVLTSWSVQWPILYLIFIGSIGGHGLYYWLLSQTNPVFPSIVVICITINCNNCGIYHFREPLNPTMGMGGLSYIDWCIFGQSFNTTDLFQKRAVIREGDVVP
ncbi:EamA family transporter [Bacillus cereus]